MGYGNTDGGGTSAEPCTPAGGEPEPSDSLRTFGAVVQALREHTGLAREEFAARVGYSRHTVASIEQGRRMPDLDFVERAESALGDTGALRRAAPHLTRRPGLASWFRRWARLEGEAVTLWTYECRVIPGLLQTEAYARAVTAAVPPVKDAQQVDQLVRARLERQRLFDRRPPIAFSFIVEQSLLERGTGGPEVTRELLDHLLERSTQFNVDLQIMPLHQPDHAGFDGPLMLLESPENKWFGYAEGQRGGMLIADPKEVSITLQRYAKLRSQALTPDDSRSLLKRLRGAP
ncbi:helix-turn-helix transcriptional regulator [Streptomyces albidoflavus]|uniref:helix-turn-helix domain-containing protein n=1 Tax=Streptomyces sp. SM8 TaxID=1195457 RepID=UPI000282F803|nr:helix-turn-helix transcriptional regulator [Streptomyces sp. SM8]PKA34302.1 transcriptional regulator [Streptomyces sp. SM8]WTD05371.1 helix-turn-helix transcriptional regulator [Streptomyces albidoflavus]